MNIILHCSDSNFGNAALITKWHALPKSMEGRGWSNIGYHFVILNGFTAYNVFNKHFDGHLETGRPLDDDNIIEQFEFGAHTKGKNFNSVGICLIGKSGQFSKKQISALENNALPMCKNQFDDITILQHSNFDKNKPHCAGFKQDYLLQLNKRFS